MNCDICQLEINALVDNQLSETQQLRVITHISNCTKCENRLNLITSLKSQLANQSKSKLSQHFDLKLHHKIKSKSKNSWHLLPYGIAASILSCFVIGYLYTSNDKLTQNLQLSNQPNIESKVNYISQSEFNDATNIALIDPRFICASANNSSSCNSQADYLKAMSL